ncbi:indole-3-glycerol phosphate synthase TrpC [Rhodospirillum rubrum]|uniref:Indole-3-glycerol phosphate synthase n=1 Tax=Rhodospirillum rubrum (strain ATCC 11170 / ATH 1.1.1 / DSM 467 / LMG 4362 / NCIMB 8255 / S1) TaxID=269796 RepID=TRPC_RHORT|nr:indole-3-glycerol phosphate synthase TrpC [Rhodospirillum rubrum]Q2RT48.1 RecName: Full=Indole-3-glycerol phosphate synthase; Short=IGPS [Rhodospirillum rubrum ATCC 11170]ABC22697.1 indole-3-glycerol phosphate synthase [Rhodospirillum rubrum ATCC 11170]AEO48416.1 indole-3-glycerol phosphate synthase [Rhodospirillum rubrum F11]MBK5954295.1 indole-3-glycerol-phosphate synthase [Rhodospirillum rubrum]QXG78691.1 indole-3-glycerol phosphate synthase TrpC [Rhodospirillum rubrum]
MSDILREICDTTRAEVARRKAALPLADVTARAEDANAPRGFANALTRTADSGRPALIAEIKKASPSAGLIRPDFNPAVLARAYHAAGATCLSVLTDGPYFQGHADFLIAARAAVPLPVLRKDFMVDPWQVVEARAMGADCILVILAALDDGAAAEIEACAHDWGMDVLAEVHNEEECARALTCLTTPLLGVNNRNLKTLVTDLAVTERLAKMVPADRVLVAESGLRTRKDLDRMTAVGARRFLIGEHFMRQPDVGDAVRALIG